jgi:uncharacterized membrane protein YfcA
VPPIAAVSSDLAASAVMKPFGGLVHARRGTVNWALVGAAGGLVVGLTSVGSGSLIIVVLLALYPKLRANDLVGTDLLLAIPVVTAAARGHAFFGDLKLDLAAAVLVGSVPGVLIGSRVSSRAPAGLIRSALVVVLLASALKLFDLPTAVVGIVSAAAVLVAVGVGLARRQSRGVAAESEPERVPA